MLFTIVFLALGAYFLWAGTFGMLRAWRNRDVYDPGNDSVRAWEERNGPDAAWGAIITAIGLTAIGLGFVGYALGWIEPTGRPVLDQRF